MQIPILNGTYVDVNSNIRTSYPLNLVPVVKKQGISNGYLRPSVGIIEFAIGTGFDRGAINWNDLCYRVMGENLIVVNSDGSIKIIGSVKNDNKPVKFDYSFDRLAILSSGKLWYYDGITLRQVVDIDLGNVVDFLWIDGYFMTTDGTSLIVTELNSPTSVNPLKYGSSEIDPDGVKAILKLRNEVYAINRNTIEVFENVGGILFPFQRISGAQIMRGAIGTRCCCLFSEAIAFLGSARNEQPAIWLAVNGSSIKISTREIDQILSKYDHAELESVVFESSVNDGYNHLYIRLPNKTLVYDQNASAVVQEPVWFILSSSIDGNGLYRAINRVWCYNKWIVGDPLSEKVGVETNEVSSHWDEVIGWEFNTDIIYNESKGLIFHEIELIILSGQAAIGKKPYIQTSYSLDGVNYSQEKTIKIGKNGDRNLKIKFLQQGVMQNWRTQKFKGTSDCYASFIRIEARIEALYA